MIGMISAGISAVGSIAQGIMGASQMRKAQKAIESYKRQDFVNVAKGISISTKGAEMASEVMSTMNATSVDALQAGGVRGVVGGIQKIQTANINQTNKIVADLDKQVKEKEKMVAQDEVRIQGLTEEREKADLAGLGQQQAVGQQNLMGGIAGLAGSMGQFAGAGAGGTPDPSQKA